MPDGSSLVMAILATLFALGSRFVGRILTTALGWASTLLFGRVPASRQYLLLGITFGSVIWMVLLLGVLFPDVGTFLLVFVPEQDLVPETVIRLIMLIAAAIVPAIVGALTLLLGGTPERDARRIAEALVRGYPLTALLAVMLVFLAGLAIFRKARSLARGWTDAHVPFVVEPGRYDDVAADLDRAVTDGGLEVEATTAPAAMSKPAKWLAAVAGSSAASLVPDRMIQLVGPDLKILIYPSDLLVSGKPGAVARARAAMASRLTTSAAHLTVTAESQAIEDRLARLATPTDDAPDVPRRFDDAAAEELRAIDEILAGLEVPYEEWEVLYRQRLQVERDLRVGAMAGEAILGAETPGVEHDGALGVLEEVGRLLRSGAGAVMELVADERTGQVLDRVAGPQWRWAARAASVAAYAAREAGAARTRRADGTTSEAGNGDEAASGGDAATGGAAATGGDATTPDADAAQGRSPTS